MGAPESEIAACARHLGFTSVGLVPLGPLPRREFVADWLAHGRAGEMRYLERRAAERLDPLRAFPWARALICATYAYRPPPRPPADWRETLTGRIAAYAGGTDYHDRVLGLLEDLARQLGTAFPGHRFLAYVDTGPIVERAWAAPAGLGWIGRNTLLLDRIAGSYFFLGELVTDLAVDAVPLPADHCGTCARCVAACPTGALEDGYTMDPRRCISYLTIEHRSAIPVHLRPALENWIFGCDVCQEVCPWNAAAGAGEGAPDLQPSLRDLLALDEEAFRARFAGTAVARAKRGGLLRNVAVALGNSGNPAALAALLPALHDPDPLVRGHVAWALGRIGGGAARRALDLARGSEADGVVRCEIAAALDGHPAG